MVSRETDLAWSIVLGAVLIVIIFAGFISGKLHQPQKVDTYKQVPTFQRGDCFELLEKEVWEHLSTPDGIIERVGNKNYLVIFREQADKRGGEKFASMLSILTFDSLHRKVTCPDTWVKHSHDRAR